jgi:hypothetical protein
MANQSEDQGGEPGETRVRQPYVPPQIRRIQLSVDEALMSICKGGLDGGPYGPCQACLGGGS